MIANIAAYQFVTIDDPESLVAQLREHAEAGALRGTVLVAPEGINLFLAGVADAIDEFLVHLRSDARFTSIVVKHSRSATQPFARLKVRHKREIISFRRADASPLGRRADALEPARLAQWIERGCDDDGHRVVLVDTRNREEVAHGTFDGALTFPITTFGEFPDAVAQARDGLADATIVSFCTGGIRCEKAALWMRANRFERVWQLDGGILGYFEQVGAFGYSGRCFVFDERVALDSELRPLVDAG